MIGIAFDGPIRPASTNTPPMGHVVRVRLIFHPLLFWLSKTRDQ
jgi:hypothetical protein